MKLKKILKEYDGKGKTFKSVPAAGFFTPSRHLKNLKSSTSPSSNVEEKIKKSIDGLFLNTDKISEEIKNIIEEEISSLEYADQTKYLKEVDAIIMDKFEHVIKFDISLSLADLLKSRF